MAAIEANTRKSSRNTGLRVGWFAAALFALGLGLVGAVSMPSKPVPHRSPAPPTQTGEIRTTPEHSSHVMPPPVEQK